jgi:hypothetical protein
MIVHFIAWFQVLWYRSSCFMFLNNNLCRCKQATLPVQAQVVNPTGALHSVTSMT